MNKRELAKNFSVSLTTVDKWLSRGCPYEKRDKQYSFDLPKVIAWHREYFLLNNKTSDFQQSKAKKEHYRAELARLEFEKESGLLVEKAEMLKKFTEKIIITKDAIWLWSKTLPPEFGLKHEDQKRVAAIIQREARRVLTTWASGIQGIKNFSQENQGNAKKEIK